ncbi:MAG TPA: 4-hydroxybenzoate octaprenyltransferase [Gammaproteobacteria bacterium]|nr:4-hydroxybenzoate octaprenyltransferase [Gammaproteobacteria bacterium]
MLPSLEVVRERLLQYAQLMRLDRPIGILLLLWPTLWALLIAGNGHPEPGILAIFVLGVVVMRSAGCVINDYADREIDPYVRRTRNRPIADGRVSPAEALKLFVLLCLIAFGLVLLLNWQTMLLSVVAVMLAAGYPFAKRYTHLPQVVLGAAFSMAIPMAFTAQTGEVTRVAWLLFIANLLWTTAYDTMYAMVDREDDLKIGVKSTAILFGDVDVIIIGIIQAMMFLALFLAGALVPMGAFYYMGVTVAIGLALYQQELIKERDRDRCFEAFLNNNWLGMVIFIGIVVDYMVRTGG